MTFTSLPFKDPSETVTVTFLFGSEILTGETITGTPTCTCTLLSGPAASEDANPSAVLNGPCTVTGTNVMQSVTGGLDQNAYFLKCTAMLNSGRVLVRKASLPVSAS